MSSKIHYDGISLLETDCAFEFQNGKSFTESGAWILERRDTGLFAGMLYAYPKESKVGSWDGSLKIPALFLNEWYSNMGDKRQLLRFEYQGRKFSGTFYKSNSDLVRIRELADNERGADKVSWHGKSGLNDPSRKQANISYQKIMERSENGVYSLLRQS